MRILLPAVVVIAGIGAIALWPADAEDRVRDAVRDAVRAFSEGRARDCLDLVHADFVDRSEGQVVDRDTIRAALLGALGSRRGGTTWAAVLDEDDPVVHELDAAAGRSTVGFTVRALRLAPGAEYLDDAELVWEVAVDATLVRGEDGVWRFTGSEHRTVSGRPPYR